MLVALAFLNETVCDTISEIIACFLNQTAAKFKAQFVAEDLLGLRQAKDCAKDFHRLGSIRHQIGNVHTVGLDDVSEGVLDLRCQQVRCHYKVAVETGVEATKEDSFVARRNEWVIANDEQQVLEGGLMLV